MALSVSGFPEQPRQLVAANEVFTGESAPDGSNKTTLMNSPRLRGLFGASGVPNKKPDSTRISSTTSKAEETEGGIIPSTPPIAPASLAFASSFEPLSQEEYELELQLPMSSMTPKGSHRNIGTKRPQLPPLPRKAAASPVRLGPSLGRLDIGGTSRALSTVHPLPKHTPTYAVLSELEPKGGDASKDSKRPLPSVPNAQYRKGPVNTDSDISSAPVAAPSRYVYPTGGSTKEYDNVVAGSSRQSNAVAGPSRHPNAVAGSSRQLNTVAGPSEHSSTSTQTTPSSSDFLSMAAKPSTVAPRMSSRQYSPNMPSLSMRYQSLVVEPTSVGPVPLEDNALASPVRPLPRLPPLCPSATFLPPAPDTGPRRTPPAASRRPVTNAGILSGSFAPDSSTNNGSSRLLFESLISWRTRPGMKSDNALRASSPPLPISSTGPRSRSHSRPRRDKSLDSFYSASKPVPIKGVPPIVTNVSGARNPRSLPSPIIPGGARLLTQSHTFEQVTTTSKPFPIQTGRSHTERNVPGRILSPGGGRRSQPPTPPAGPVRPRQKAISLSSPSRPTPPMISVAIPVQPQPIRPANAAIDTTLFNMEAEVEREKREAVDAPLHSHPSDMFVDNDSLLHVPMTPDTAESPVDVFVDDQDLSTLSRSPSPMRYARPDSREQFSEDELEELDFASSSSTMSSPNTSPNRRRRTQLRSYRMSYRPHAERTSPPHIPFRENPPSPKTIPEVEKEKEQAKDKKDDKKQQKKKTGRYFDFGSGSVPTTRASSPERKSRSRQPRKLADAVSLALDEVRNRGRVASTSPKPKPTKSTAPSIGSTGGPGNADIVMEVLDISRPKLSRRNTATTVNTTDSSSTSEHVLPPTNSAKSSAKIAWGKAPVTGGSRNTNLSSPLSNAGMPTFAKDEEYEWVRAPRHAMSPAAPLPTPQRGFRAAEGDEFALFTGRPRTQSASGGSSKARPGEFNIVTTVSASRPPSSSTSSPFSAFSMSNRSSTKSKAKQSTSSPVALPVDDAVLVIQPEQSGQVDSKMTARMTTRTVDKGGDIWEHERNEDVADVIPHLRQLKAKR